MNSDNQAKLVEPRALAGNGGFDVVALAASAGGLRAISQILAALPASFPAAIVVVQHLDPRHRSLMADILSRRTALHVEEAKEGTHLNLGTRLYSAAQSTSAGQSRWDDFSFPIGAGAFRPSLG